MGQGNSLAIDINIIANEDVTAPTHEEWRFDIHSLSYLAKKASGHSHSPCL